MKREAHSCISEAHIRGAVGKRVSSASQERREQRFLGRRRDPHSRGARPCGGQSA